MANEVSEVEAWTNRLVSQVSDAELPCWARDLMSKGYARSVVLTAYVKWDRDTSARGAYA